MNITTYIEVLLGNSNLFIALVLCCLPVREQFRLSARKTIILLSSFVTVWFVIACAVVAKTGIDINLLLFPMFPIFFVLYWRSLKISLIKALTLFAAAIAICSFTALFGFMFAARTHSGTVYTDYTWLSSIFSFCVYAVCLAIFWYPASTYARWMIENIALPVAWKSLFIWTLLFIAITNYIVPRDYSSLEKDRYFFIYLMIVILLFICMLFVYFLIYCLTRNYESIEKLELQNQFLDYQSMQYQTLSRHLEDTARMRHDFRQQLRVISNLVEQKDYDTLSDYLSKYQPSTASEYTLVCANPALNAILSWYDNRCREQNIPVSWAVNLPKILPIPEPEFCVMVGNLLENAIDASMSLPEEERSIQVISHMASASMLVLLIENRHHIQIMEKNGHFTSTKHSGKAIGLKSVKETAALYQGDVRIEYDEKKFSVGVILNV